MGVRVEFIASAGRMTSSTGQRSEHQKRHNALWENFNMTDWPNPHKRWSMEWIKEDCKTSLRCGTGLTPHFRRLWDHCYVVYGRRIANSGLMSRH